MSADSTLPAPPTDSSVAIGAHGFDPQNAQQLMQMAKFVSNSELVPKALRGKPADCFLVMALGRELGFGEMQSLQIFNVINGKLVIPGEICGLLIQSHPLCADYRVWFEGDGETLAAFVQTTRRGRPNANEPTSFSWADAKRAGLTGGDNWKKYPKDMLLWKAVAREKRYNWPDVAPRSQIAEDVEEPRVVRNVTPLREEREEPDGALGLLEGSASPAEVVETDSGLVDLITERAQAYKHPWAAASQLKTVIVERLGMEIEEIRDRADVQRALEIAREYELDMDRA